MYVCVQLKSGLKKRSSCSGTKVTWLLFFFLYYGGLICFCWFFCLTRKKNQLLYSVWNNLRVIFTFADRFLRKKPEFEKNIIMLISTAIDVEPEQWLFWIALRPQRWNDRPNMNNLVAVLFKHVLQNNLLMANSCWYCSTGSALFHGKVFNNWYTVKQKEKWQRY